MFLTDRQIATLYLSLAGHYQHCVKKEMSPSQIYNELVNGVDYSLNSSSSPLRQLNSSEREKVFNILNTFFYATPHYHQVSRQFQGRAFFNDGTKTPSVIIHTHYKVYADYYQRNDDFLFKWLLISQLTQPSYTFGHGSHHHPSSIRDSKEKNEAQVFLYLLILAAVIAACAFIALYYMLSETIDSFERFFFNEGWMQATINLLSLAVMTTASALLASTFASSVLFSLALAAGVSNPFGWVVFGVIGLSIIGGALGHLVSKQIQNYIIKQSNQNALDPQDPSRFTLTDQEASALVQKGIDPIKVKCALVALRAEQGDKPVPSLLTRLFWDSKAHETLSSIRALRSGIPEIKVGKMHFNCRLDALLYPIQEPAQQSQESHQGNAQNQPSAPFLEERYQYTYATGPMETGLPPSYAESVERNDQRTGLPPSYNPSFG